MLAGRCFMVMVLASWSVPLGAAASPTSDAQASAAPFSAVRRSAPSGPAVASVATPANAADKSMGPEEWKRHFREAVAQLHSADPGAIQQSLASLRELRGREAAEVIVARVRTGLPPLLAETAVETLGALNQPLTTPVLVELTVHRRWQIREKAISALGALRVRSTVSVLLYALDDPSPEVRSAAARALGTFGDARALPALTAAVEHGVDGALTALAQLATAKQLPVILARAKLDLKASEPALKTLLSRSNLAIASKLNVVQTVRSFATPQADALLVQWRADFAKGTDPRLVAALGADGAKR